MTSSSDTKARPFSSTGRLKGLLGGPDFNLLVSSGTRSVKSMSSNTNKQTVSVYRRIDSKPMDNLDKV